MREIKFRFYQKTHKQMCYWDYVKGYKMAALEDNQDGNSYSPWMQCTGLKDKNGVEIYEGDIVKGKAYEFRDSPRIIGDVIYDYCEFKARSQRDKTSKMKAELNTTYEVIGNIYENPELLQNN